ncbi:MAG TPA: shikimate dehydrogenase, partial [Candidatus Limnocylindria bacterium]
GAANTIVRRDNRLLAYNTDRPAVSGELSNVASARRAVVLGNGGAARAVVDALDELDIPLTVVDRERWAELPTLVAAADLLVNATPIGTDADESPVPEQLLRPDLAVFDLVYRPTPTRLVTEARSVGAVAQGGASMLLGQAVLSFELWTGRHAPVAVMAEALRVELGIDADA